MSPTTRGAALIALVSSSVLVVPVGVAILLALAAVALVGVDALMVRRAPRVERDLERVLSRGVPSRLIVSAEVSMSTPARVRQPVPADIGVEPPEGNAHIEAVVTPRRRGRHAFAPVAVRLTGPLGLGSWTHNACGEHAEVLVYPDLPAARRLASSVRRGRFRAPGLLTRGPLGLGTDFEAVRDYLPDDDIRQVNWRASARLGRPMSNTYRIEQDRDVICVVDTGRLMAAPIAGRSRLDAAIDAASAVAFVADELGDRCGALAFDATVRRQRRPRRAGGGDVVKALFDLEATSADSDYELAFRTIGSAKRAFVIVFTDLLEESAARPLVDAVPFLVRRHAVAIATATDTDIEAFVRTEPDAVSDVYAASVAIGLLDARTAVVRRLEAAGARVVDAPPDRLGAACVDAYLKVKARARI